MKSLKVAYARTQFWFNLRAGGSVGHTIGVLKGFKKNNADLKVFSNERFLGIEDFEYQTVKPFIVKPEWFAELIYNLYAFDAFKKAFLKFNADVIYHRYSGYTFFVSRLARALKTPLILEFNSFDTWKLKHWEKSKNIFKRFLQGTLLLSLVRKIENYNLSSANVILTVSDVLKDDLLKERVKKEKIIVIPNGFDPDKFDPGKLSGIRENLRNKLGINKGIITVGFSGTFGKWHGIPQLTEAILFILQNNLSSGLHFLIIGDGNELKKDMKDRISSFKEATFIGTVPYPQIQNYLMACDILLSPHSPQTDRREFFGSPTKLFEYMAMGKGIIASNLGQIGKVLKNGETAVLVEPGNVEELIQEILKLSKDSGLIKKLGDNARRTALANYSWEKNIKRLMDFFRDAQDDNKK